MARISHIDDEMDMEFIREFSVGASLTGLSVMDRSERIRLAIYANHLAGCPFRDTGMDYASAFRQCYGRPIEMRRRARGDVEEATDED